MMESGKHRMSLKLMKGEGYRVNHLFGLVRDGAAWDKYHGTRGSTDAWYMVRMAVSMVMGKTSTMTVLAISRKAKS